MAIGDKLRGCDQFGAPITLKLQGEDSFKTLGGGIASMCLRILVFSYLCMQLIVLIGYKDPTISGYKIMKERDEMEVSLNAGDLSLRFYFGMVNAFFLPVEIRPEYGRFRLYN